MKPDHAALAAGGPTPGGGVVLESPAARRIDSADDSHARNGIQLAPGGANGSLANGRAAEARRHTLVLAGRLDSASTLRLEAEIERLCEAGMSKITLDLRALTDIDAVGVAVIVFRRKWARRRGCELVLIRGARQVQHAFELAGVAEALAYEEDGTAA